MLGACLVLTLTKQRHVARAALECDAVPVTPRCRAPRRSSTARNAAPARARGSRRVSGVWGGPRRLAASPDGQARRRPDAGTAQTQLHAADRQHAHPGRSGARDDEPRPPCVPPHLADPFASTKTTRRPDAGPAQTQLRAAGRQYPAARPESRDARSESYTCQYTYQNPGRRAAPGFPRRQPMRRTSFTRREQSREGGRSPEGAPAHAIVERMGLGSAEASQGWFGSRFGRVLNVLDSGTFTLEEGFGGGLRPPPN